MPVQQTATVTLTLVIYGPLSVTTTTLPPGEVGQAYSCQLAAAGGEAPLTWSATGLPAGLTISTSGLITGIPTAASSGSVSISVQDSES